MVAQLLSSAFDEISLDPKYFARIETLYAQRDSLGLDAKQMRILTRTYDRLRSPRREARRGQEDRSSRRLTSNLSSLFTEFNSRC